MRLFLALDIDEAIRERISRFMEGIAGFAPDARWTKPESLHITLKFIGEQPESAIDPIKQAVSEIHAAPSEINFRNYGFFPTAKSPRVFWIGVECRPPTRSSGRSHRRQTALARNRKRNPSLQPASDAGSRRRRLRLSAPQKIRRAQPHLPAPSGKTGRPAHPGVWYHDAPRVLSVPKPSLSERIDIHQAGGV